MPIMEIEALHKKSTQKLLFGGGIVWHFRTNIRK
jgi:hypothetical protein